MMINNNPYNLPERPLNKTSRVYIEPNITQFRAIENPQRYPNNPQIIQRMSHQGNSISKKPIPNLQQINSPFKQSYPSTRAQVQLFNPYQKIQVSNSGNTHNFNGNLVSHGNINNQVQNNNACSSLDKKQTITTNSGTRESFNAIITSTHSLGANSHANSQPNTLELIQINDKIQAISYTLKSYQKRILQLQKNAIPQNTPSISQKIPTQIDITPLLTHINNEQIKLLFSEKLSFEWQQQLDKIKQEIQEAIVLKNNKILQVDREKLQQLIQLSKIQEESLVTLYKNGSDELKKQIQMMRGQVLQVQQLIKTKFQFLTAVISRVERQSQNNLTNIQNNIKPSAIKCSTTAILLRFVECFKVKKNGHHSKNGQIKITLTDNTYYIDCQGYLLDKEHFYLMDGKGAKIQLEEKHLKLLKQQSILI